MVKRGRGDAVMLTCELANQSVVAGGAAGAVRRSRATVGGFAGPLFTVLWHRGPQSLILDLILIFSARKQQRPLD